MKFKVTALLLLLNIASNNYSAAAPRAAAPAEQKDQVEGQPSEDQKGLSERDKARLEARVEYAYQEALAALKTFVTTILSTYADAPYQEHDFFVKNSKLRQEVIDAQKAGLDFMALYNNLQHNFKNAKYRIVELSTGQNAFHNQAKSALKEGSSSNGVRQFVQDEFKKSDCVIQ